MTNNFDAIIVTDTPTYPNWTRGYGAHRIATHLRENGYSVLVVDFSAALTIDTWEEILKVSVGPDTRFVGFSTTWWPYRKAKHNQKHVNLSANLRDNVSDEYRPSEETKAKTFTEFVAIGQAKIWLDVIKKYNPKTKILLGGAKIDWYPDFPADHFMSGYSEVQILDFLQQPRRIWNKLINHDTHAESRDWGWSDSFTRYTEYDQIRSDEILTLEAARGCRFKCLYCAFPLIGKKDIASYIKSKDALYKELLENYERWGITSYWIADDTVNDSNEKLQYMAEVIKLLPFKPKFRCYLRLDILAMNPQQAQLLLDIGMVSCFFGIETFHPKAAKLIGKGMDQEKRKQALYDAQKIWGDKVSVNAGYIIGLPNENYADMCESHAWFMRPESPVHAVFYFPLMINPVGVYPNHPTSELDRTYEKHGYTIPDLENHEFWFKDDGTDVLSFARAFEIIRKFNDDMDNKPKSVIEQIRYGMGNSIVDPTVEYFPNLISMLKRDAEKTAK
jgi:hypothetical protein